jgi:hypothetical protein
VIALLAMAAGPRFASGDPALSPRLALDVQLLISPHLTSRARGALIAEADRIWRREGVHLGWYRSRPADDSFQPAPLRVLVVDGAGLSPAATWPVAELVPLATGRAIAIASIESARRVVGDAPSIMSAAADVREQRLGLVLGRAVAHEIGHFLLGSAHSGSGLMREGFDAREFADQRAGETFHLDDESRQGVRERVVALIRPPRN